MLRILRQGINSSISPVLIITNLEVILREFLGLIDLFEVQIFCIHELSKVVIIGKYKNFILRALHIILLKCENFNNDQKLKIVSMISSFNQNYLSKKSLFNAISSNYQNSAD